MKKISIISILLILSIVTSIFSLSMVSTAAASKPTLSVKNIENGQKLSFDRNNNTGKMYLYFGVCIRNGDGIIKGKNMYFKL